MDAIVQILWEKGVVRGDVKACLAVSTIMLRRAQLLGLTNRRRAGADAVDEFLYGAAAGAEVARRSSAVDVQP